jgi:DnaK suppressor protein
MKEKAALVAGLVTGDEAPVQLDQTRVGRLSRMDALQSQALAQNVRRRREERLIAIARALQRMDEDEYGYCLSCGEDMDAKRLGFDPAVERCVSCAEKEGM